MIATAVLAVGSAAIGIAGGMKKNSEGKKMQREAQKKIDNFKWDELTNPYKTQQVSTLGADLQIEQNNLTEASTVDALRLGGNRAIAGGLGRLQYNSNFLNSKVAADLDQQRKAIDMAAAQDDARIRAIRYDQQVNELAGYGTMLSTGMNMKYSGMADISNGVGALGQAAGAYGSAFKGTGGATAGTTGTTAGLTGSTTGNAVAANLSPNIINGGVNYEAARQWSNMINLNQNTPDYNKLYGFGGGLGSIGNN